MLRCPVKLSVSTLIHRGISITDEFIGVVTNSNVTLIDDISGVLGLGFPRLSEIYASILNGAYFVCEVDASEPIGGCGLQPHRFSQV